MQKKLENKITSNISFAFYFKSEERGLHKLVKNRCTVRPNQFWTTLRTGQFLLLTQVLGDLVSEKKCLSFFQKM